MTLAAIATSSHMAITKGPGLSENIEPTVGLESCWKFHHVSSHPITTFEEKKTDNVVRFANNLSLGTFR